MNTPKSVRELKAARRPARRVIKFGGSLLRCSDGGRRLIDFLNFGADARNLIVVGGGQWVDAIRQLDKQLALGELASHWLAIGMMDVTACGLARRLGFPHGIPNLNWQESNFVVRMGQTLDCNELRRQGPIVMPASWDVTSDSLAAWVAIATAADELILLKSKSPDAGSPEDWARQGFVDPYFPSLAGDIPVVRAENLGVKS